MEKAQYQELFLFAAKAGALEGYLFERKKVEPLDNWIDNISRMYQDLPAAVQKEVAPLFSTVLERILKYGERVLEPRHKEKLERVLAASSAGIQAEKAD